jgi:hypothetical protein
VIQDSQTERKCIADYQAKGVEGGDNQEIVGTTKSFVKTADLCVNTCGDEHIGKL